MGKDKKQMLTLVLVVSNHTVVGNHAYTEYDEAEDIFKTWCSEEYEEDTGDEIEEDELDEMVMSGEATFGDTTYQIITGVPLM